MSRGNCPGKAGVCTKSSPTRLHSSHPSTLSPRKFPRSQGTVLGAHPPWGEGRWEHGPLYG